MRAAPLLSYQIGACSSTLVKAYSAAARIETLQSPLSALTPITPNKYARSGEYKPRKLAGERGWKTRLFWSTCSGTLAGGSRRAACLLTHYFRRYFEAPAPATHALSGRNSSELPPKIIAAHEEESPVQRCQGDGSCSPSDDYYRCYWIRLVHAPIESIWLSAHHARWCFSPTPFCCFLPETLVVLVKPFFWKTSCVGPVFFMGPPL